MPRPRQKLLLAVLVLATLVAVGTQLPIQEYTEHFLEWVRGLGAWGPIIFVLIYVFAVVVMLPTWGLSIGAGILFGTGGGLASAFGGAAAGATIAFLLGRTVLGETVRGWIDAHPRLRAVDREIERRGWIAALLLRLSPLTPWNILNYVLGVTRLSLRGYIASFPAMLPVLALYTILGATMGRLAAPEERETSTVEWVLLGVGLVSTVVVTVGLARVATRRVS